MKSRDKAAAGLLAGAEAGHQQARLDKRLAANAAQAAAVAVVPLDSILARAGGVDTRQPTDDAVAAMAESLDALGLLEPLVVDRRGRLLAGKTRLLALRRLAEAAPDRWAVVPVRRMDLDAEAEPERALAVEVAENERRRDYTPAEVRELADRLRAAGFQGTAGRPRKGGRALLPALGAVVGRSKRTLLRYLDPAEAPVTSKPATWAEACGRLRRALGAFDKAAEAAATSKPDERRAVRDARALADLLDRLEKHNDR